MSKRKKDVDKIENALILSHREPARIDAGPVWQERLMSRVLEEERSRQVPSGNGLRYSGAVWRFALATCLVALLLGAYLVSSERDIQYQMAELILDDSAGMHLAGLFTSL